MRWFVPSKLQARQLLRRSYVDAPPSQALYAWYADQTATQGAAAATVPAPAAAVPAACPLATATATTPAATARQLRKRGAAKTPAGGSAPAAPGGAADLFAVSKHANRQRPLVLLVQGAEQANVSCMRDLIKTLALVRALDFGGEGAKTLNVARWKTL